MQDSNVILLKVPEAIIDPLGERALETELAEWLGQARRAPGRGG